MSCIRAFLADENGTTIVEYCVIAALISIVIVASASSIGSKIHQSFYGPLGGALN